MRHAKRVKLCAQLLFALLSAGCVRSFVRVPDHSSWEPWQDNAHSAAIADGVGLADRALAAYQRRLRRPAVAGSAGCNFWPSCSVYARTAFATHGVLLGFWRTANRLFVREALMESDEYVPMLVDEIPRFHDPAE